MLTMSRFNAFQDMNFFLEYVIWIVLVDIAKELVKLTPTEHVDYENLVKCLNVIKDVCIQINENKRNAEGVEEEINKQVKSMKSIKKVLIKRTSTIRKLSSSVAKSVKKSTKDTDSAKESESNQNQYVLFI